MFRDLRVRRVAAVLMTVAALLSARDGARSSATLAATNTPAAPSPSRVVTPASSTTTTSAPGGPTTLHPGAAPHTENGIIADGLTALREQEWKWVRRTEAVGEKIAFAEMVKEYDKDPVNEPYCHQMVHELGRQSYLRHKDLEVALSFETNFCGGGFSHGVFESWGRTDGKGQSALQLSAECDAMTTNPTACGHGIGHAIMQSAPPLDKAVATCSALSFRYQWPCIDGVTMMYAMSFLTPDPNDPRPDKGFNIKEFCSLIPDRWAERCEYAAGALWVGVTHFEDRSVALKQCLLLERDAFSAQRCSYGIGDTVLDQAGWDASKVFSICRSGPSNVWVGCAKNALRRLVLLSQQAKRSDPCKPLVAPDREFCTQAGASRDERDLLN